MYLSHWGLSHSPFQTTAGLAEPYPTEAFNESTARFDYLLSERRRAGALLGRPGFGKSTVLESLPAALNRRGVKAALVDAIALSPHELLWQVASQLGAGPDSGDDAPRLYRRLEETLTHRRWLGQSTALLVDNADQAGPDLLRQLTRLSGLESAPGAGWTLLLASDPRRLEQLGLPLLERIDLRIDLFAWSIDDTVGYIQTSLVDAGRLDPIFTDLALERLHARSEGVPRRVVRLADFALVAGAAAGVAAVGPDAVDHALEELRWSPAAEPHLVG